MKFIKKHWFTLSIVLIFLAAIALVVSVKIQNIYEKNPELMPPQKDYTIQVSLAPEKEMEYETNIMELNDKIKNVGTSTGVGKEIDLGNGIKGTMVADTTPKMERFIEKSRYLTLLGRYNEAIETMNEGFKWNEQDVYGLNWLAAVYEDVKEYQIAIQLYQKLINEYPEYAVNILPEIVRLYVTLGDKESAAKNYVHYELSGGVRNELLMQEIRVLE